MSLEPDEDVVAYLATALSLTAGTDVFSGPELDPGTYISHKALFCLADGGPPPQQFNGETTALRRSDVSILVRSDEGKFEAGLLFARSVRDAIHYAAITGYIDVRVLQHEPNWVPGEDADKHFRWTVNVQLFYEE